MTAKSLSPEARRNLTSLSVDPEILVPDFYYYSQSQNTAVTFFGIFGALYAASANRDTVDQLNQLMIDNDIAIDRIVRDEFIDQLRSRNLVPVADGSKSVVKLTVLQYGLSIPDGFTSALVPILWLRAELFDPEGTLVWRSIEKISPLGNPVFPKDLSLLINDPETLRAHLRAGARTVVSEIIDTLAE